MSLTSRLAPLAALAMAAITTASLAQSSGSYISGLGGQSSSGGIANFQITGSGVSSGAGRTSSSLGLSTLPGSGGGVTKPFATLDTGPALSPYLNLFNTGVGGGSLGFDNYNTVVRPQLRQQRMNQQLQRQSQQLNMKVQAISARPDYQAQGSDQMMATGHTTVYRYYSHFYPSAGARRR